MIKSNDLKIILLCPLRHFWSRSATGYEADIYPVGRVRGSYYPYPTRPVDIPISD